MVRADSEGCAFKGSADEILAEVAILLTRIAEKFTKDELFDSKEDVIALLVDAICGAKHYNAVDICASVLAYRAINNKKIPFEELMKEIKEEGK